MKSAATILLLLTTACATKSPTAWRIEGRTLIPPGRPQPIRVQGPKPCASTDAISATRHGSRTVLAVNPESLGKQPSGWLSAWAAQAEDAGCVPAGGGDALATRILESAPQSLNSAYRLLHADHARSGYVDLGPRSRLEVITPIRREGADAQAPLLMDASVTGSGNRLEVSVTASPDLLGVERAWYAVRPDGIVRQSVEAQIQGETVQQPSTSRNPFEGLGAGVYRLVYKSDQTSAIQVAASRAALEKAGPESCDAPVRCMAVPRFVAVNPYLAVMVNGKEVVVGVGATLRSVIRTAGKQPADVMGTLQVTKPFAGKMLTVQFDRTKPDVLDLVLLGNEIVAWD